jgi:transcriptional regulator with XRE-family HTH domain
VIPVPAFDGTNGSSIGSATTQTPGNEMSFSGGQQLKRIREELRLSMRDVENAAAQIAARFENQEFACSISRISDIETKGVIPSIFRLFSFSVIYGKDHRDLCALYGINWDTVASARECIQLRKTHRFDASRAVQKVRMPTSVDPGFDIRRTTNVARMVQTWGLIPASFLSELVGSGHTYAFVGTEDFTMYPLVMPGSFLQIDESRRQVINEGWKSEYERPIYFLETREEFICAWCNLSHGQLITQPHPLSPASPRIFRHPQQAEVIGQVVGVAMRLNEWMPDRPQSTAKSQPHLN